MHRVKCSKCGVSVTLDAAEFPFNHCGIKHQLADAAPSLIRRAANLTRAAVKHVTTGRKLVDDFTREWRREQCLSCVEYYDAEKETCSHPRCGCGIKKQRGILDKLGWASQQCPIGRWENPPMASVLSVYRKTKSDVSIGLGVNAGLTATALREAGTRAKEVAAESARNLTVEGAKLVVFEGCWAKPDDIYELAKLHPATDFTMRCHSQVAFLQIEPDSIGRLRDVATYSQKQPNIWLSGNSRRFTKWAAEAWGADVRYLPNLYPTSGFSLVQREHCETLRIASFGAMRLQKHHSVSAAAAALLAKRLGKPVEFYVNEDNGTAGGSSIMRAIEQIVAGTPQMTLHKVRWQAASEFRKLIAQVDLCFQMSASETFNLVTADAAASGVPTVCGEAIDWVPSDWHAPVDDPIAAADAAERILADETAGQRGQESLAKHSAVALREWTETMARS